MSQPRTFSFPRAVRMRRERDFARVRREGRRLERAAFVLWDLAVPGEERRVGVVCGKRVGTAPTRNRVRRRMREIFRTSPDLLRDGRWFVIAARPPAATLPYDQLRREVRAALAPFVTDRNDESVKGL